VSCPRIEPQRLAPGFACSWSRCTPRDRFGSPGSAGGRSGSNQIRNSVAVRRVDGAPCEDGSRIGYSPRFLRMPDSRPIKRWLSLYVGFLVKFSYFQAGLDVAVLYGHAKVFSPVHVIFYDLDDGPERFGVGASPR
jgi:hypothetical protein